ncbi:NAD(P)/FAD-dependent oxidoreductase [Spirillospora sp. CA-128828]|uniref:NAD(P)/FAD-dependent oxidoreductase n=1 Tax=Spirillospora sp. CA-128828 TaxID=3240033 RepID=UPI003D8ED895
MTPRAVRELKALGIAITGPGWFRNKGIRLIGAGRRLELGLTRTRTDLDEILAGQAVSAGATLLENTKVTGPLLANGRMAGVRTANGNHEALQRRRHRLSDHHRVPLPEYVLRTYPAAVRHANGGPFTLGRAFTRPIDDPRVMRLATRQGLSHPSLTRFALKILGGLPTTSTDRLATALTRMTPAS